MTTVITDVALTAAAAEHDGPVDVTVDGDTITHVAPHSTTQPADVEVVDGTGLVLAPGFIDTHVHLLSERDLQRFTDAGVTTVAELGTHPDSLVDDLRRVADVTAVFSAGSAASAPGGTQTTLMGFPAESTVDGPDDAERFVQWRIDAGADVVKVIVEDPHNPTPGHSPQTLKALADAARAHGLLTIAHAATVDSYRLGLDAGFDVLTHAPVDRPLEEALVARMVEQNVWCSPTLVMMRGICAARRGLPGPELRFEHALESVRRMHAAGVRIAAGTDANDSPGSPSPVPHGVSLHEEMALLVEAGMTPAQAVTAATSDAAASLGLTDRGLVTPGRRADLVLLGGDPATDIAATRDVRGVWIAGRRVR